MRNRTRQQEFKLLLKRSGASSAYAAYALADVFTLPEYWVGGTQYSPITTLPGYTFTRSGTQGAVDASGAVQFFAANVPAINSGGFHAYGALTNDNTYSQDFSNAAWTKSNATITANTTVAKDGTTTADTLTASAGTTEHRIYITTTSVIGVSTKSVFAKAGTANFISLSEGNIANGYAVFDLSTGVVSSTGGGASGYIVSCGGGWYRCVLVYTFVSALIVINIGTTAANAVPQQTWNAAGTETVILWEATTYLGGKNYPDGGPLITTTTAALGIGESVMTVNLANGTYSATYTFDDNSTQTNAALVIADGVLNTPTDFVPNRNIIKQLLVT